MEQEIWKDIEGYEGKYQVSNCGRVKSLGRYIEKKGQSTAYLQERILSTRMLNGYKMVHLCSNNKEKTFSVHRLIAIAFIPNPNNFPHIDHINTIRTDNRVENLRWVNRSMNMMNEITHKKRSEYWKEKTKKGKNIWVERKKRKVIALDENYNIVYKFNTINEAAKFINRNHANICVACKDIHKTCKGLHWQYVE